MTLNRQHVLVCAIALLAGSGSALGWAGKGSWEPSTPADRNDGFMFLDSNPTTAKKLYFNGFLVDSEASGITVSPNVAMLNSSYLPRRVSAYVMMGVWQDCNKDGYIGNGEAQHSYSVAFLPEEGTFCTATPGVYPTHNDGKYLYEFIPLVYRNHSNLACCDVNVYVDNHAKVWGDMGLQLDPTSGAGCTTPPDAYQSTGGLISRFDCSTDWAVTGAINSAAAATGQSDLSFADKPNGYQGESNSKLNQPIPTGNGEDESYVYAFDCSDKSKLYNTQRDNPTPIHENPTGIHILDIAGQVKVNITGVWNFATDWTVNPNPRSPPAVNQGGSFWGTVNETENAPEDCDREDSGQVFVGGLDVWDRCLDTCESLGRRTFNGRFMPDLIFTSAQWNATYNEGDVSDIMERDHTGTSFRQFWYGPRFVTNGPFSRDFSQIQAKYFTYYGQPSDDGVSRHSLVLPGASGAYGQEACAASANDGVTRFDCTKANWWKRTDGSVITPRDAGSAACFDFETNCDPRAFVGDTYRLRDIDCYDYSAKGLREESISTGGVGTRSCI